MPAVVTFDGANRVIQEISNGGDNTLDVIEIYSEWKEWVTLADNAKFLQAFRVTGGDPVTPTQNQGTTFFLTNGWRIRPAELSHTLTLNGNLFVDGGVGDPTVDTVGNFNARVVLARSNIIDTVSTGGGGSGLTLAQLQAELNSRNVLASILDAAISSRVEQATLQTNVQLALTNQGFTVVRAGNLDNLDAPISGLNTGIAGLDSSISGIAASIALLPAAVRDVQIASSATGSLGAAVNVIEGLSAKNRMYIDQFSYDTNGFATSCRIRVFQTPAQAASATDGGIGEGEILTTIVTGVPNATFPGVPDEVRGVGQ